MAGCSSFVGKADPNDPLPYGPANYDQKVENGAAVFTLSSQGKQAMADKDAGVVKQKKKSGGIFGRRRRRFTQQSANIFDVSGLKPQLTMPAMR